MNSSLLGLAITSFKFALTGFFFLEVRRNDFPHFKHQGFIAKHHNVNGEMGMWFLKDKGAFNV